MNLMDLYIKGKVVGIYLASILEYLYYLMVLFLLNLLIYIHRLGKIERMI